MHTFSRLTASLFLLVPLLAQQADPPAQDPLRSLESRLHKAIAAMAALPSCAFDVRWGPDEKNQPNANGGIILSIGGPDLSPGKAEGGWDAGDLLLHFEETGDDLRYSGRRAIARQPGSEWQLRRGRFADGNEHGFVPDPQQLLQVLTSLKVSLTHRAPDTLFDRPVEVLSATLNEQQVADLVYSGLLPPSMEGRDASTLMARQFAAVVAKQNGNGAGARTAPATPKGTFDLAFFFEPGTGVLHRIAIRTHQKADSPFGGRAGNVAVAIQVGPGGQAVVQQDDSGEEDDETKATDKSDAKASAKTGTELEYAAGLPIRPRKKMSVYDLVIDLHDHGAAKLPPLDDAQKALLGVR